MSQLAVKACAGIKLSLLLLRQMSAIAENFSNNARANGTAAFTDCETQTVVHRDRVDQGNNHFDVVAFGIPFSSTPSGSSMVPVTSVVRK